MTRPVPAPADPDTPMAPARPGIPPAHRLLKPYYPGIALACCSCYYPPPASSFPPLVWRLSSRRPRPEDIISPIPPRPEMMRWFSLGGHSPASTRSSPGPWSGSFAVYAGRRGAGHPGNLRSQRRRPEVHPRPAPTAVPTESFSPKSLALPSARQRTPATLMSRANGRRRRAPEASSSTASTVVIGDGPRILDIPPCVILEWWMN